MTPEGHMQAFADSAVSWPSPSGSITNGVHWDKVRINYRVLALAFVHKDFANTLVTSLAFGCGWAENS